MSLDILNISATEMAWLAFVILLLAVAIWFFRSLRNSQFTSHSDWKNQLDIIEYFSKSVFRKNETDDILWDICASCIERLGLEDCVIYLKDENRQAWIQKAAFGPKNIDYRAIHEPIELPFGQGIVGRVGASGVAEVISDTSKDSDYVVDDAIRGSEMAVPIFCDDEVIGVIDSEHTLKGFFNPSHLRIMQNIANICGQKIGRSMGEKRVQEFAKFFELNPNPVARLGTEGQILLTNNAALEAFGVEFQIGKRLPLDHPILQCFNQAWEREGAFQDQIEIRNAWYQVSVARVKDKPYAHMYAVDVTEVQNARSRAKEAERHKSDFLSVMSHEIRTPLNAILGLIELLMREDVSEEDRLSHLSYMEFAGKHLQGLLTDVLDLERLDTGNATPHLTPFDPREWLKRVVNGFTNRAQSTGNQLEIAVDENVPKVLVGDVGWMTQMVNNLVANALKFTTDGSIDCRASWQNGLLTLAVQDTGKGIAEGDLGRILEPFEQANKADLNVSNDGVGLGLAITKKLCDLHGGAIRVQSELGRGTTFEIQLPLETSSSLNQSSDTAETDTTFMLPDAPVLVVDDNELNVLVAHRMISNWGYDVVTAKNVDEAEDQLKAHGPFVVLLDIHMPGRDGFQATKDWRKATCPWKDISIVGLTADAESHTRQSALESGMDDVVVKPFNPPHLRSVLEQHAMRQA